MHFAVYQTATRLYVVRQAACSGADGEQEFRVLKADRTAGPGALELAEDPTPYTKPQLQRLLAAVHAGNHHHGGLQLVCEAHAIIGCVKFLEGWYLLLVTKRRYLGAICGHKVYGIDATALLPILSAAAHRQQFGGQQSGAAEVRYRKLLAGVQLNTDFFFSYSWPVHQTAQATFRQQPADWDDSAAYSSHRVWNEFLSRPLRDALGNSRWVVPLAHGFFQQRPLALLGRTLQLTLVGRRSRQYAGTRYLKRGVTDQGYVANDVEVEQVVEAGVDWKSGQPLLSSMVQVRGSIPLPWAQLPDSSMLKPEIVLHRFDPLYASTRRHFEILREQYGDQVCVLDLVKRLERRPRESKLGSEYATAIRYLNQRLPASERVQYLAFDLSHHAKTAGSHLLADLQNVQAPVLNATGIFVSGGSSSSGRRGSAASSASSSGGDGGRFANGGGAAGGRGPAREQHGILRTNCIDSLDRTNIGQFSYGLLALGRQLHAMGIAETARLDPNSSLARHLMDAYEAMGHTLALQYGGSEAHTTFFQRQRGDWEAATQSRDLLTTVRRFYSNAYTDADKQDAINLFLGNYEPAPGRPHLWDLGSDAYLHAGPGRTPGRTTSLGSRSCSFSVAAGQAAAGIAAAAAAAAAASTHQALASFPAPVSPPPPPPSHGRLGSPPLVGGGMEPPPPLVESMSAVSLASLSSDGSFAPTLSALVAAASPEHQARLLGCSEQEEEAEQAAAAATARAASGGSNGGCGAGQQHEHLRAEPGSEPGTPPAEPTTPRDAGPLGGSMQQAVPPRGSSPTLSLPPRPGGPRRSPLLGGSLLRKAAKLESLDKLLSRQPVAHVRLTATPAAPKQSPLGWLSPGKATAAAAAAVAGPQQQAAADKAAARAAVAGAGPGMGVPVRSLRRSNSDPSMASSLGSAPCAVAAPAAAAAAAPRAGGRHVTFEGGAAAWEAHIAPSTSGLQRHSTAPSSSLAHLADAAAIAAAAGGGSSSRHAPSASSQLAGQLLLVQSVEQLAAGSSMLLLPGSLRSSSGGGYHALAGLNLEGAGAAEASIKQGPAPAATAKPQRRISFPNFARLRALTRKASLDGGGGSGLMGAAVAAAAAGTHSGNGGGSGSGEVAGGAPSLLHPTPSLLGPHASYGSGGHGSGSGAPAPLNMTAVVYGAEAVRRGIDTLGVAPAMASCWLTGADPLAAMMEEQQRLHAQIARQREALCTPLDPVDQRALLEQYAALMRPSWALSITSFTQGARSKARAPPPSAIQPPAAQQQPVAQPGLAF